MIHELLLLDIGEIATAAIMVIAGKYGNGEERRRKLEADGYNAKQVQLCVNDLIDVFSKYT